MGNSLQINEKLIEQSNTLTPHVVHQIYQLRKRVLRHASTTQPSTTRKALKNNTIVSPYFKRRNKRSHSPESNVGGILAGNTSPTLSQAIALVESRTADHMHRRRKSSKRASRTPGNRSASGITASREPAKRPFNEANGNMVAGLAHNCGAGQRPIVERSGGSILRRQIPAWRVICNNRSVVVRALPPRRDRSRSGPKRLARHRAVRGRRDTTSSSSKRGRSTSNAVRLDGGPLPFAVADFRSETNCKASSAAIWRWPT